ncbi:hypothetical protein [Nonomuraea candida]|uniref:hypothetical protein n=1 Tax=Nonomuraea candida TaxID=359159 RepID=UPI0012FA4D6D|nr:hypothetical protein [Nonomuraea candida]
MECLVIFCDDDAVYSALVDTGTVIWKYELCAGHATGEKHLSGDVVSLERI